jgi:hypothetical protein
MADIKDVTNAVKSALEEIGVTGEMNINSDEGRSSSSIGERGGDDVEVTIAVKPIEGDAATPQ